LGARGCIGEFLCAGADACAPLVDCAAGVLSALEGTEGGTCPGVAAGGVADGGRVSRRPGFASVCRSAILGVTVLVVALDSEDIKETSEWKRTSCVALTSSEHPL
jgi:hypothetical protein